MAGPETSIVIRTFNEEKFLPELLSRIRGQAQVKFEIIVVDSGSVDSTRDIAGRMADKVLRIDSHDFTFGFSLNAGISAANGEFVAMASGHTLPLDQNWLVNLIDPLRNEKTAMVYGRQVGYSTSKLSETSDLERIFGPERKVLRPPQFFANNANSAIRRDLWEQHRFDEVMPGLEDIEWAKYWMERGYEVVYEPEAALYHVHEESWRQVRNRYYREAVAARWIGIKGPGHVVADTGRELGYAFRDFGRSLAGRAVQNSPPVPWAKRVAEIALFRANKTFGLAKGLLDGAAMNNPITRERVFFDRSCRAVRIAGPGKASMEELEIPDLKPGDVLIRVAYEAICATDLEILDGILGYYKDGTAKYPIVPGHEFSGRVVAVGTNVRDLSENDPVVVECIQSCGTCVQCRRENWIGCTQRTELGVIGRNGGYSEYVVVPGRFVHRIPPSMDLRKACLCEPLAVVNKGLRRFSLDSRPLPEGSRCAVVGAGPLGQLCALLLETKGYSVTAFDRNPARLAFFQNTRIRTSSDTGELANFSLLVEATGSQDALDTMMELSPAGATILLLGLPYAHKPFSFERVVAYDKTIVGSVGSSARDFDEAIQTIPKLDLKPFTSKVFPFKEFREAWDAFRSGEHLKILLEIDGRLNQHV